MHRWTGDVLRFFEYRTGRLSWRAHGRRVNRWAAVFRKPRINGCQRCSGNGKGRLVERLRKRSAAEIFSDPVAQRRGQIQSRTDPTDRWQESGGRVSGNPSCRGTVQSIDGVPDGWLFEKKQNGSGDNATNSSPKRSLATHFRRPPFLFVARPVLVSPESRDLPGSAVIRL